MVVCISSTKEIRFHVSETPEIMIEKETDPAECGCISVEWDYEQLYQDKFQDDKKAGAVLVYKNKCILVQSRGCFWGFPKGFKNPGENICETINREVKEETSLSVSAQKNDKMFKIYNTIFCIKYIDTPSIDINIDDIKKISGNDCTGVALVDLQCLKHGIHDLELNSISRELLFAVF